MAGAIKQTPVSTDHTLAGKLAIFAAGLVKVSIIPDVGNRHRSRGGSRTQTLSITRFLAGEREDRIAEGAKEQITDVAS